MRDFYPEDMAVRNALFDAWRTAAVRFGFVQYDACVVETLDLLKRKAGEEIVEQIYFFTDKSNRELALRPEMTPTLARMVAARQGALAFPLKWFAIAQCFRYERMTRGRKREHYQWNLDIVGEDSVSAEAEVLATAVQALSLLGMKQGDYFIHFSSRALLTDLLLKLGIQRPYHPPTFLALDKRGKITDDEIHKMLHEAGLDADSIKAVFSLLSLSTLDDAARMFDSPPPSLNSLTQLLNILEAHGIRDYLKFDISVVRGLSYYTGVVFEAFDANRKFRAIFGGGRYDNLLNDIGGTPATAVGLGFGDVVVTELLQDLGRLNAQRVVTHGTAIGYMEEAQRATAVSIAAALRKSGTAVDLGLRPERAKAFFARAGKSNQNAIYIGPDDIGKGSVRVKDLMTRAEKEVPIRELTAPQA